MNICLLEPTASVLGFTTYAAHNILEPLGIEYLASYLESLGHNCNVVQQRCEPREKTLEQITEFSPDILGVSTQAYNIDDGLWFAREAKKRITNVIVVLGGYHATAMPELVEGSEVDYVVMGEGEIAFANLLDALKNGQNTNDILGVASFDGKLLICPRENRINDLDALPFPKRDKKILSQCRMHGLMCPPPSRQNNVGMITATRGCPYSCAFCCSELIWNKEIKKRSTGNVADEIEVMVNDFGVNAAFFCDLTFNADKRYAIRLCSEIEKRDLPIQFYAMCNLRGMDFEIAQAMAAAKVTKIGFGVESFIETTRTQVKDRGGMDLDRANTVLDDVSKAGVLTKCYFIIGFPWETNETLSLLEEDISNLRSDEIKATFYVPFPGTRGYDMHKSLLSSTDWSNFTTLSDPVVRNDNVSANDLIRIRKEIFTRFYNGPVWAERVKWRMNEFPQYSYSFKEFVAFLREQGILKSEIRCLYENETT